METYRLLQFTDTHLFPDPRGRVRDALSLPRLKACIGHAARRHLPADAIVVTGDLVHDDPTAYDTLGGVLRALDTPVLLIPGNHDRPAELRKRLGEPPFQVGGAFRLGRWTILLLATWLADSIDGEGRVGGEQLDWLERELRANHGQHVLVCLHHPPILMESAALDALGLLDAADFMTLIEAHPNVRGLAWGHAHQSLDVFRRGLRLMCTPATCMQFIPRRSGFVVDDRPPGYRVIDLQAGGGLASEVVWLEGYQQ
jgi:Icc protein